MGFLSHRDGESIIDFSLNHPPKPRVLLSKMNNLLLSEVRHTPDEDPKGSLEKILNQHASPAP
jgi:hypothetical protein